MFGVTKAEGRLKPYCLHGGLESLGGDRQGRREETDSARRGGRECSGRVHSLSPRIPWLEHINRSLVSNTKLVFFCLHRHSAVSWKS